MVSPLMDSVSPPDLGVDDALYEPGGRPGLSAHHGKHQIRAKDYRRPWVEPIVHRHVTLPDSRPQAWDGVSVPRTFLFLSS